MEVRPIRSEAGLQAALDCVEGHLRFGHRRGRAFYAEQFRQHSDLLLIAKDDSEWLGVLLGSVQGDAVLIGEVVVAPAMRRPGIGSQLLRGIEVQARRVGLPRLRAGAAEGAEGVYLRNGFAPTLFITLDGEETAGELERLLRPVVPDHPVLVQQGEGQSRAFLPLPALDEALRQRLMGERPGRLFAGYLFNKAL